MTTEAKRIALITIDELIIEEVKTSLSGIFETDTYSNALALHYSMQNGKNYTVVISDGELESNNGIALRKALIKLGYEFVPIIILLNGINNEKRALAIKEGIADILVKPLDQKSLRTRIPFLADNFTVNKTKINTPGEFRLPLIKRIFDITFSAMALLLLSPLFLLTAILIRAESKGPVFYYSLRVGSGYKIFKFYKFRSMFTGADAKLKDLAHLNQYNINSTESTPAVDNNVKELCDLCEQAGSECRSPLFADNKILCEALNRTKEARKIEAAFIKIKDDPRITRIGKFIRNASIDELPQLWNVFIGNMSIVGNRPLPLYEAEKITTDKYSLRFMAPAGITGLWQVEKRGRGEMSEDERLNLDNNYAKTHSFVNDIKLILRTIPAMFQLESV